VEKAKFDPSLHQNPLTDFQKKLAGVITSWMPAFVQNFVVTGSEVFAPQKRDFAVPLG